MTEQIILTRADDMHLHLRDGAAMSDVLGHSVARFARAIVMPNLKPAITTTELAIAYKERIMASVNPGQTFEPLMTLYLTDMTSPQEIVRAKNANICACKLYPAGATTNSEAGVTDVAKLGSTLETMQRLEMPLLVHGEVTDPKVDIFDREAVFIDRTLMGLRRDFPALKIVFEHITTRQAVQYVREAGSLTAATITAHHLLYNRNAIFEGGIRCDYYCLPVLKRESHRQALLEAATSGEPQFFLGTDSAPHPQHLKIAPCGCAGCYTAYAALELYAQAFESVNALDKLQAFASFYGADFYGLPRNGGTVTLLRKPQVVPHFFAFGSDRVTPVTSGQTLQWSLAS